LTACRKNEICNMARVAMVMARVKPYDIRREDVTIRVT
jgi:hypothetical protein